MIDLHCHLLPGVDDGASGLSTSLDMARMFVADGVEVVACTPHILPGVYHNSGPQIRAAIAQLQAELDQSGIPLRLVTGADIHVVPDFVAGLRSGRLLTLADTRYVLVEPPHHVAPVRLEDLFFDIMTAGYVPILTHPERLAWIKTNYATIQKMARAGVWMQITAASLMGSFGRSAQYWGERMLEEGLVHILATDAHDTVKRPPSLSRGRDAAAKLVGSEEARQLVVTRPQGILANLPASQISQPSLLGSTPDVVYGEQSTSAGVSPRADGVRGKSNAGRNSGRSNVRTISERLRSFFE